MSASSAHNPRKRQKRQAGTESSSRKVQCDLFSESASSVSNTGHDSEEDPQRQIVPMTSPMTPLASRDFTKASRVQTHYELLQVQRDASALELRKAYLKMAKKTHPDRGGSKQQFQAIALAFETLRDPEVKSRYDRDLNLAGRSDGCAKNFASPAPTGGAGEDETQSSPASCLHNDGFALCLIFLHTDQAEWRARLGELPLPSLKMMVDHLSKGLMLPSGRAFDSCTGDIERRTVSKTTSVGIRRVNAHSSHCRVSLWLGPGLILESPNTQHSATLLAYHLLAVEIKVVLRSMAQNVSEKNIGELLQSSLAHVQRKVCPLRIPWTFRFKEGQMQTRNLSLFIKMRDRSRAVDLLKLREEFKPKFAAAKEALAKHLLKQELMLKAVVKYAWDDKRPHGRMNGKTPIHTIGKHDVKIPWAHDCLRELGVPASKSDAVLENLMQSQTKLQHAFLEELLNRHTSLGLGDEVARRAMSAYHLAVRDGIGCMDAVRAAKNDESNSSVHGISVFSGRWSAAVRKVGTTDAPVIWAVMVQGLAGKMEVVESSTSRFSFRFDIVTSSESRDGLNSMIKLPDSLWRCTDVSPHTIIWECNGGQCILQSVWRKADELEVRSSAADGVLGSS